MTDQQNRRVFVVLGLYRPDPDLLSRQLESIVSQTYRNAEILVCPDGPCDPASQSVIAAFSRAPVHIAQFATRAGVHANFARGLRQAVAAGHAQSDLFAFCDQDDFWHPEKLERQVAQFDDSRTSLVHSDARIVSREGEMVVPSLFRHEARSRRASFADLLIMNSVTGMTALFRRDVAVAAEPFALAGCRFILHDHWTALVAALLGDVRFIDEPLVDYTQHAGNVLGARAWEGSMPRGLKRSSKAYLRKCYRQFIWRRRALEELRHRLGEEPEAAAKLTGRSVRALFECGSGPAAGLYLSILYRLRGDRRQADQIWRIWRGKSLYCDSERSRA